jgi:outer membrane protein assembly factor BamA
MRLLLSTLNTGLTKHLLRFGFLFLACYLMGGLAYGQSNESDADPLEEYRGQIVKHITIRGTHVTEDYVVAREIWTDRGKPLDPELVNDDIARLQNLSIFGSVVVEATSVEGGVDLDFQFTEMPWLIPYPAVKYTEENGISLGVGLSSPNFAGKDVTLSASLLFGGINTFNFSAANPWIMGNHVSASVRGWHRSRDNVLLQFRETSDLVGAAGGSYLGERGRAVLGGAYYAVTSDQDSITLDSDNTDNVWMFFGTLGYDSRDSWRVPHNGWRAQFTPLFLGGDAHSWTAQFDVRRYQPLAARHTIVTGPLFSFQSGAVGVQIPSYMQYFLGGANTIRGFKLEELGREIFGKHQLLYTLEYRYLLVPLKAYKIIKWTVGIGFELAAFGDAGIAWSTAEEFSWDRTRFGYGLGFRVLVPSLGQVRFDMGISQYGDVVFNFGIGSIFEARSKKLR